MAWFSTNWGYRKKITIASSKIDAVLTNFPVCINETDADLKHTGSGGQVGKSDGTDILFTLSDGTTQLSHEIEQYVSTTGKVVIHVKVPSVSATVDTDIYIYYGYASASDQQDITGTWDGNFESVHHHHVDPSSSPLTDSTTHGRDFTVRGSMTTADFVDTDVGKGWDHDGTDDGSYNNTHWNILSQSAFTLEQIFETPNAPSVGHDTLITANGTSATAPACLLRIKSTGVLEGFAHIGGASRTVQTPGAVPYNQANYGAFNWLTGGHYNITLNGTLTASGSTLGSSFSRGSDDWEIADWISSTTDQSAEAIISETRISSTKRSSAWMDATYETLLNPSTFYSTAAEESAPTGWAVGSPLYVSSGYGKILGVSIEDINKFLGV